MIVKQEMIYTPKGKDRPLHIYLPDGWEEGTERYPVMYFFDGHNLFSDEDATYGKSWGLKQFMENWDKPMIIVGIECGHDGYERLSEYLPYEADYGFLKGSVPMGDKTMRWILDEIKPMIDEKYPTWPFRECTGIGGSSMGGLMALYAVLHYNTWFSKAACVSSAIGLTMADLSEEFREQYISPDTRVFLSWGTMEAHGIQDPFRKDEQSQTWKNNRMIYNRLMEKKAYPYLYCQVGGNHCEADWEKQVPIFMEFLWKDGRGLEEATYGA